MAATDEKMLARQYIYRLNLNKLKGARPCCNQNYYQGHPKPTYLPVGLLCDCRPVPQIILPLGGKKFPLGGIFAAQLQC